MNSISVPMPGGADSTQVLSSLSEELPQLTPELRKAASYVLENPNDVGVSSIREIADAADVKPNTFVRLARSIGFDGYEGFRSPFREEIRKGVVNFPDRARWLQSIGRSGKLGGLYRNMVSAAITNIEETFAGIDERQLMMAAKTIWKSRQTLTLGVGVNSSNAQNFTYLASTGMKHFHAIPRSGSTPIDDLAWADKRDVLIAITCKPYRSEVVEAVRVAKEQGVKVIGISDSAASPIIVEADHGFVVSADTPQFFPSSVSTIALLETLLSFVIAVATPNVVSRVEEFHDRRHQLGIYEEDC
ncbi:MAG: MurR/RpiR family transcriptional regulator [Granulosicoccus sp.]